MNQIEITLEYNQIKDMLCEYAVSPAARRELAALEPSLNERECRSRLAETTEARRILDECGGPPLSAMTDMEEAISLCEKEGMLSAEQLEHIARFLNACRKLKSYLKKTEADRDGVAGYGQSIWELTELKGEIDQAVQGGQVLSSASPALRDIRRKIEHQSGQIKRKLDELLRGKRSCFSENGVSIRNGRYVLPVRKEYKHQVSGSVVDISGSGATYFIEPSAVSRLQDEINTLKIEEDNEIRKVLYTLTALVDECMGQIKINMEAMTALDVVFAKARLSAGMGAVPAELEADRTIEIRKGRHPLLRREECVPLDFTLGGRTRGVVITGPNTGGKTVALKTVGLLSMMAQSGLHVPAEGARFPLRDQVLCDIGDGQSITENLSTFSSHITNVIDILSRASRDSLVLLDELGSGTDPAEGMGIAVSILEELRRKGCLFVATTHYPEVKEYAAKAAGLQNARMAFDRESLKPLYRLEQGEAGESCALYIARRLGFPEEMLERAARAAYGGWETEQLTEEVFFEDERAAAPSQLRREAPVRQREAAADYAIGDSVTVGPEGKLGLVFRGADAKGMVGVQIQGVKSLVNHKRLTLKTPASELYPPDYDFSILFDSVENRKARHQMERRFTPGLTIRVEEL